MRVIVFLLMTTVAVGGSLFGYRLITGKDLINPADLGFGGAPAKKAEAVTTPLPTAPPPTATKASPHPTATPTLKPDIPQLMLVANTDGYGVYMRRTPNPDDKLRAWQDGTKMEVIGQPVESGGKRWYKVRAPDGVEGYIPAEFLVNAP